MRGENDDKKKLIEAAGGEFSLDYYCQAMADVVKPLYKMLKA